MNYRILNGDVVEMLKTLPDDSVDAIVTDPPYGLEFMGKDWDSFPENPNFLRNPNEEGSNNSYGPRFGVRQHGDAKGVAKVSTRNHAFQDFCERWAVEALRVLKPGGHLLSFGGSRTYHRMACAIEDVGFEIRDQISNYYSSDIDRDNFLRSLSSEQQESFLTAFGRASSLDWSYGSGFPKSLSVAKASQSAIESRYGKSTCNCMDSANGQPAGDDSRRGSREEVRVQRTSSFSSTQEAANPVIPFNARRSNDSLRELRQPSDEEEQGFQKIETSLLQEDLRGCGTEDTRFRHASLWAGMEECESGDTEEGQGLSGVQQNSETERECFASTPSETIQVRRNEPSEESSGAMRVVSSSGRENNRTNSCLDPNRHRTRRIISDNLCGRESAVAHVCSWCGLPSQEWLNAISELGTALKPAHDPIVLARKPLIGTVVENILTHGTGALNIAATRIPGEPVPINKLEKWSGFGEEIAPEYTATMSDLGRWPANLIYDGSEDVLEAFGGKESKSTGGGGFREKGADTKNGIFGVFGERDLPDNVGKGDSGSVARFFYCAKASKEDRNEGCWHLEPKSAGEATDREDGSAGLNSPRAGAGTSGAFNHHPTVKPTDLMRYLCKMITPPGGTVLDCFMGSGSTGKAALMEGFNFIGIEKEEEYCTIAKARMEHILETHLPLFRGME